MRRELETALELALVAPAPAAISDSLARASGLLDALAELPLDAEPLAIKASETMEQAKASLVAWHQWVADRTAIA